MRYGVDPYAVNHVWPLELRARAAAWMTAEVRNAKRRRRRGDFWKGKR